MEGLAALLVAVFIFAVSAPLAIAQAARQDAREGRQDARQSGREGRRRVR